MAESSTRRRPVRGGLLALLLVPVIGVALTACTMSNNGTSTTPMAQGPGEVVPDDNVPVNVFIAGDNQMIAGQVTELVVILNETVTATHGDQTVEVVSTFYGADTSHDADDVWEPAHVSTATIAVGEIMTKVRVRVDPAYTDHGLMKIKACTLRANPTTGEASCPAAEERYVGIEINP